MFRALTTVLALGASAKDTVELTDGNFEHDTQASTGMTTGDWFVMFHAAWCGHCKNAMPEVENFATKMKGQMNVGLVEVPENAGLAERFRIQGFPTFKFFAKGKMYDYDGGRKAEAFESFVTGGYQKKTGMAIPVPLTIFNRLAFYLQDDFEEIFQRRQFAAALIAVVCFFLGIMLTLILQCILCAGASQSSPKAATKRTQSNKKD